jgi:hypothetical protein
LDFGHLSSLAFQIVERGVANGHSDLVGQGLEDKGVILSKGVHPIALYVEDADDLILYLERHSQLGLGVRPDLGKAISRFLRHVAGQERLTLLRYPADDPFSQATAVVF